MGHLIGCLGWASACFVTQVGHARMWKMDRFGERSRTRMINMDARQRSETIRNDPKRSETKNHDFIVLNAGQRSVTN